jgi:hypothetical protein
MHDLVWRHLEGPGDAEGPTVLEMDIAAGRKYLRQCILNMSQVELRSLRERDAAALLARGARGAAAYRKRAASVEARKGKLDTRSRPFQSFVSKF